MFALECRLLALAFLEFALIQPRLQDTQGDLAVLNLRALVLARHHNAGRNMAHTHRRISFVDMLAACSGRAIGMHLQVFWADYDVNRILDVGHHLDFSKRGVPTMRGVKTRE